MMPPTVTSVTTVTAPPMMVPPPPPPVMPGTPIAPVPMLEPRGYHRSNCILNIFIFTIVMILLVLIFAFGVAALAEPDWVHLNISPNRVKVGLFRQCVHTDKWHCSDFKLNDSTPSGFNAGIRAVRAFTIIGVIFTAFTLIAVIVAIVQYFVLYNPLASFYTRQIAALLCIVALVSFVIAFFVFLGVSEHRYHHNGTVYRLKCHTDTCKFGQSFWFVLVCWILAFICTICLMLPCRLPPPPPGTVQGPVPPYFSPPLGTPVTPGSAIYPTGSVVAARVYPLLLLNVIIFVVAVILIILVFSFGVAALAEPDWVHLNYSPDRIKVGLWEVCTHTDTWHCSDYTLDSRTPSGFNAGIRAVRAFMIMGVIFAFITLVVIVVAIVLYFMYRAMKSYITRQIAAILCIITCICFVVAYFVFLGIADHTYHHNGADFRLNCKGNTCKFAMDFWFTLVCWILALIAFIILLLPCRPPPPPPMVVASPVPSPAPTFVESRVPSMPVVAQFPPLTFPAAPPSTPLYTNCTVASCAAPPLPITPPIPVPVLGIEAAAIPNISGPNTLVIIQTVLPGGPAAMAGLQPMDIITRVGTAEVFSIEMLSTTMIPSPFGSTMVLTILRNGAEFPVPIHIPGLP